ncbi:hypothetical protein CRYUN_Cryun04dG0194600 [Craigia yunnanensis]
MATLSSSNSNSINVNGEEQWKAEEAIGGNVPLLYSREAQKLGLKWSRGLLLYGPPGTGKRGKREKDVDKLGTCNCSGIRCPFNSSQVLYVPPPDLEARYRSLAYIHNMKIGNDVDLRIIAEDTELFTGAELEGLCREAGIVALRENISATIVSNDISKQ